MDGIGRREQGLLYASGTYGHKPKVPVDADRLYAAAHKAMSPKAWGYVAGSAGRNRTDAANQAAFSRYPIVPRMLRDVSKRPMGVTLFGESYASPLLFAPIGVLEMAHPEAESAVAQASRELDIPMVLSTQGSTPMETVAKQLDGTKFWYQLYWSSSDALAQSLVRRAEAAGAKVLVVTLDTHAMGWRCEDLDQGFLPFALGQGIAQYTSDPVFLSLAADRAASGKAAAAAPRQRPTLGALWAFASIVGHYPGKWYDKLFSPLPTAAVHAFLDVFPCPHLTWRDLSKLREWTRLPIVLKGIQCADDARTAIEHGVDGLGVSNHGGRQVDGAVASLDALEEIAREVGGKVPIIFDSGIRTGADVFKALALGADAVLVGRPWLFGLAIDGARGARDVMARIAAELDLTMGLAGVAGVNEINRECLKIPKA
ncbi:hypothetical protein VHUM_03758 [Vanrija humicola]|uniref:FMN hydroxy acid dehydrogenase domain-containing protein n=1 Tax=Vanrija humicola TaxID=5417 RepID=A0A7D8UWM4_VANHU|nr:hypothetical protein VHUM_03758 [Vanrija humicola]